MRDPVNEWRVGEEKEDDSSHEVDSEDSEWDPSNHRSSLTVEYHDSKKAHERAAKMDWVCDTVFEVVH